MTRQLHAVIVVFALGLSTNLSAASFTSSGGSLSQQSGTSSCSYSSLSEDIAGNWVANCGNGANAITISPAVNGTVCVSYSSITETISGSWNISGCVSASPSITLDSPATSGATYPAGTAFTLRATPAVPTGRTVASVEFFRDGISIHTGTASGTQYVFDWAPVPGTYSVSARVTDNTGAVGDSSAVQMIFSASGPTIYYVHPDHLGSPRMITRSSDNQTVWRWDNSEPFGNSAPNESPAGLGTFTYNNRFPGQYFDSETGSAYNYFRDYEAATGRYLQSDPVGLLGGLNTFNYVNANALSSVDVDGLIRTCVEVTGSRGPWIPGPQQRRNEQPISPMFVGYSWDVDGTTGSLGNFGPEIGRRPPPNLCFTFVLRLTIYRETLITVDFDLYQTFQSTVVYRCSETDPCKDEDPHYEPRVDNGSPQFIRHVHSTQFQRDVIFQRNVDVPLPNTFCLPRR